MGIALWLAQGLLGLGFILAGYGHAFRFDRFAAAPRMGWAHAVGRTKMRVVGFLEIAGGVGVVAPAATGILPWLTPLAAAGLALIMVSAAIFHARRGETRAILNNAVLVALAAFVFFGRSFIEPLRRAATADHARPVSLRKESRVMAATNHSVKRGAALVVDPCIYALGSLWPGLLGR